MARQKSKPATARKVKHPNPARAPSTPAPQPQPNPKPKRKRQTADDYTGPRFETEPISDVQKNKLFLIVAAEAVEKASRENKTHTPTRFEVDQAKNELAGLTNIPADTIADKFIGRVRCPISKCGKYIVNSVCELKKHIGAHLPDELLPFRCGHDGCNYIAYQRRNFESHKATHKREKQLTCELPYLSENGEELLCNFVVSTKPKLDEHQKGHWDPRHQEAHGATSVFRSVASFTVPLTANASTYASPVATSVELAYASSYSPPYSPSVRSTLSSSTRVISLPPVDTPGLASKTFLPVKYEWSSDWRGGLTGCFSLQHKGSSFL